MSFISADRCKLVRPHRRCNRVGTVRRYDGDPRRRGVAGRLW